MGKVVSASNNSCITCSVRPLCLARALDPEQGQVLSTIVRQRTPLNAGDHMYWQSDSMDALYVVHSGCVKTYAADTDGNERVRGFHYPGDLIGLDGLHLQHHPSSAQALTKTQVCVLPRAALFRVAESIPQLMSQLLCIMSRDLAAALALAGDYRAEQRVAAFLLFIADRMTDHQGLALDMSRRDIANYLRLVTETVSRILTRFRDDGLLSVDRRKITIRDRVRLEELASAVDLGTCDADYEAAA